MIFRFLGHLVRRWWGLLLLAWGLLLFGSWLVAPPWDKVTQDQGSAFLPTNAPSRRAEEVYARAFPENGLTCTVVFVLERSSSGQAALDRDLKFIEDVLEPGLRQIATAEGGLADEPVPSNEPLFADEDTPSSPPLKRSIIARIRTPNAPGAGALLISPDNRALLVVVELTTEFLSIANWPTITKIEKLASDLQLDGKVPRDVTIALTGSAVIGRDHTQAELQSARATELLTLLLVIGLWKAAEATKESPPT